MLNISFTSPTPKSTDLVQPNQKSISESEEIITQNQILSEVELLSNLNNSFDNVLPETKKFVDTHINSQEIIQKSEEIIGSIAILRDQLLPNEADIDSKINKIMSLTENSRQEALHEFLQQAQADYEKEFQAIDSCMEAAEKVAKLEILSAKYISYGRIIGEALEKIHKNHIERLRIVTAVTLPVTQWINVGIICQKAFTEASRISFLKDQLSSILGALSSGKISPQESKQLIEKAHLLEAEIEELTAENKERLEELGENLVNCIVTTLESSSELLSNTIIRDLIYKSTRILEGSLDLANICSNAGAMAGTAVLIGVNIYGAIKSSNELIELKNNSHQLRNELTAEKNPVKAIILQTKLDRLDQYYQDIALKITQNSLESVIGSLALTASVEGILTAAGITLGTTAALCLNATGIGALALTGAVVTGGAVYGAYQNRHVIQHTLATAEIPVRQQLLKYQLESEMKIYQKAKQVFNDSEESLERLQLLLPTAWETKLAFDAQRGAEALQKQRQITHVYINLMEELNTATEVATTASLTMATSLPKIREIQRNQRILVKKQELEDAKLKWKLLAAKFSKYDVNTLIAVRSAIEESLKTAKGRNEIRQMMVSHGFKPRRPFTAEHVFDYISDSTHTVLPNFGKK